MRNYKNDLLNRIISLYDMYEDCMWKDEKLKLNILIQDNSISFYLYDDKSEVDNIILTFSDDEDSLYKYISINILLKMIKDVIIHRNGYEFTNVVLKPYLKLIVCDNSVLDIMIKLVNRQYLGINVFDNDLVNEINDCVLNPIFYPKKTIHKLDERIAMTRKLLRREK